MWFWILTAERLTATAAGCGERRDDIRARLRWEEVAAGARMPALAADGGLEEFLEPQPICSSRWAIRADNASSWVISCVTRAPTDGSVASR